MITFNVIIERFRTFADAHFFLKSFSHGTPQDIDLDKFTTFPLMHVVYTGSTYGSGSKTYSMEVFVMGAGPTSEGKFEVAQNAVSDSEQCLEDILADLTAGWNVFDESILLGNASISPLMHEDHNTLVGAALVLTLEVPYDHSACFAPLDGVTQGSNTTTYQRRGVLKFRTQDGSVDVSSVRTVVVPDGSLTDNGDGQIALDFATAPEFPELSKIAVGVPTTQFQSVGSFLSGYERYRPVSFTAWTITGNLQVGVVLDTLDRFVQFSGLSSGQTITVDWQFEVYSGAPASVLEYYLSRVSFEGTGNTFFSDSENTVSAPNIAPVPSGQFFAQAGGVIATYDVVVYPTVRVALFHGGLGTNALVRTTKYEITVA